MFPYTFPEFNEFPYTFPIVWGEEFPYTFPINFEGGFNG